LKHKFKSLLKIPLYHLPVCNPVQETRSHRVKSQNQGFSTQHITILKREEEEQGGKWLRTEWYNPTKRRQNDRSKESRNGTIL